jgi:hypothetical protein
MSVDVSSLSGKGKRSLTRADVEELLRQAGSSERLRLAGENISGSNLSNLNLSRANLMKADLSGADLRGTDLSRVNLVRANLSGANLSDANLNGANLAGANLSRADLSRADLSRADLSRANLSNANLTKIRIADTKFSLGPELLENLKMTDALQESNQPEKEVGPALRMRIQEELLTVQHLSAMLNTFTSLYVKMWLLQQGRFDDFIHYTEHKDRRFEEEANLLIAELKYNSPADIKFRLDLSPKAIIEALQMLIDMITQAKLRREAVEEENRSKKLDNQLKEETIKKERLNNADHTFETIQRAAAMIEKLYPGLDEEKKDIVLQSLTKDILQLAGDKTLEVSLLLPPAGPQRQSSQTSLQGLMLDTGTLLMRE